ncbi:hypothetical protein CJ030_MR1G028210 [Morella rubra]|uniref:Uncharacterized protein n=1 Tax=Morella rubra TaxID=262757 RepID=A0A6A1WWN8_9ROSI|nr:hypothetical protein CJ030_MR1G028201 [Morella rubra]KAB1227089.1 hypothetical protein CJ030_MR1G028210 [Morella rubra]
MESGLSEAARTGSESTLMELLRQDPFILDRLIVNVTLAETPLHVAALLGHTEFVKEILHQKPELARELGVSPDMCFASDQDGRNPLHLAAIKGPVDLLKELIGARLQAARAPLQGGETILHLCVKQNQLEALNGNEFVNAKDEYGFTVLHLAIVHKQIETINFLIYNTRVEINATIATGFTALDLLSQSRRDAKDLDISEALRGAGAHKATESPSVTHDSSYGRQACALCCTSRY